jgi:hypothetical protein
MKLKSFSQHINEENDPYSEGAKRLRSLGLVPQLTTDERLRKMATEWESSQEASRHVAALRRLAADLIYKWFPVNDHPSAEAEEAFHEAADLIGDLNLDEISLLQFLFVQEYNGHH